MAGGNASRNRASTIVRRAERTTSGRRPRRRRMASLLTPYTQLALVLAGVFVGALVLVAAFGRVPPLAGAVAIAVSAGLAVAVLPQLWHGAAAFDSARHALQLPKGDAGHQKCFYDRGRPGQVPFVYWLRARIPEGDSFALEGRAADRGCFQLSLLPRRLVWRSAHPRWLVRLTPPSATVRRRLRLNRALPDGQRSVWLYHGGFSLIRQH
jgi:hypothetical protein